MSVLVGCLVLGPWIGLPPATATPSAVAEQGSAAVGGRVRVSLRTSTRVLAPLHRIRLNGRVRGVRRGTRVSIIQRQAVSRRWVREGATRVRRDGRFRYSEIVHHGNRYYRACVVRRHRQFCSKAHLVRLVPEIRFRVRASAPVSLPLGGQAVLKGRVRPGVRGHRLVVFQRQVGLSRWHRIATVRTGRGGKFRLVTGPLLPGNWEFRVFKPITNTGRRASATVQVAVGTITFDEVSLGSYVTDQYQGHGVVFTSTTYTTSDGASADSPVLSGSPRFMGPIQGRFVQPGTLLPATVDYFSFVLGFIDDPYNVDVDYYGADGSYLGTADVGEYGFNRIVIDQPGVASFDIEITGSEANGFGLDDFSIGTTTAIPGVRPLRLSGTSAPPRLDSGPGSSRGG